MLRFIAIFLERRCDQTVLVPVNLSVTRWPISFAKDFTTFIEPVFEALYAHKEEILLIYEAHLSSLFMEILEDYFDFHELSFSPEPSTSMPLNKEDYAMAYRIGGIYFCLLLWFSHGMKETPQQMAEIAASL